MKGEAGDIMFSDGHAMLLSESPILESYTDSYGVESERLKLTVITTSGSAGEVVEDTFYMYKVDGEWTSGSDGYGGFQGYGQLNIDELKRTQGNNGE